MTSRALVITCILLLFLYSEAKAQLNPNAPGNLEAIALSDDEIELTWDDNSNNEDNFIVERSTNPINNFQVIATLNSNTESYNDDNLSENTRYYYRVKARNYYFFGTYDSQYSNVANDITFGTPHTPTNLNANAASSTSISLSWQYPDDDHNDYEFRIESSKDNTNNFKKVKDVTTTDYLDTQLKSDTRYYYRVRAENKYGKSDWSNIANALTSPITPTLDPIPDPNPILENADPVTINLTGISAGGEEDQDIVVSATSANTSILPHPSINYSSPNPTGTLTFQPQPNKFGTVVITVRVQDSGNSTPDNPNFIERSFSVEINEASPDLRIQNFSVPAQICEGTNFQLEGNVRNTGATSSATTVNVYISENQTVDGADEIIDIIQIPGLNRNTNYSISGSIMLPATTLSANPLYIIAKVDPQNSVAESNENNNESNSSFTICRPDLIIENESIDQNILAQGLDFNVAMDAVNNGSLTAGQHIVKFYLSDSETELNQDNELGSEILTSLGEGASLNIATTLTVPSDIVDGSYHLIFWIDSDNEILESNEENNIEIIPITIQNLPDLSITSIQIDPVLVSFEQEIVVQTTVENKGTKDAPASSIAYYLSIDSLVGQGDFKYEETTALNALAIGESSNQNITLTIPASFAEGDYYLVARVDDELTILEHNELNNISSDQISIVSDLPPTIVSLTFPEYRDEKVSNTNISINAVDDVEITEVKFKFRGIRAPEFDSATISLESSPDYTVSLPGAIFDELGLEFYFEIFDDVGLKSISEKGYIYRQHQGSGLNIPHLSFGENQQNYRMISIPLQLDNQDFGHILEDNLGPYNPTKWRLFHIANEKAIEFKDGFLSAEEGKGYWIIVKNQTNVDTGAGKIIKANQSNKFKIQLQPGWNQIGNPYNFDIKWSQVLSENGFPAGISGSLTIFENGFKSDDVLKAFQGALVYSEQAIALKIPVKKLETTETSRLSSKQTQGWQMDLSLGNGNIKHQINTLGMVEDALDGMDDYDEKLLPSFNFMSNIQLQFKNKLLQGGSAKDIVSIQQNYSWDVEINNISDEPFVYISWDLSDEDGFLNHDLHFFNPKTGLITNMMLSAGIWIDSRISGQFKIIYGDDNYLKSKAVVDQIGFMGGYPNPFNHNTKIPIAIPNSNQQYDLQMEIYNSLGQNVLTLIDTKVNGGAHEFEWTGKDSNGNEVLPGLYFLKVQVDNGIEKQNFTSRLIRQ